MPFTGEADELIDTYKDLDAQYLIVQLVMLKLECSSPKSVQDVRKWVFGMSADACKMSSQVERLLWLLLVCPVSIIQAERSFSALHRLKIWLRNNIG